MQSQQLQVLNLAILDVYKTIVSIAKFAHVQP